jgi:hypothetical protein
MHISNLLGMHVHRLRIWPAWYVSCMDKNMMDLSSTI